MFFSWYGIPGDDGWVLRDGMSANPVRSERKQPQSNFSMCAGLPGPSRTNPGAVLDSTLDGGCAGSFFFFCTGRKPGARRDG